MVMTPEEQRLVDEITVQVLPGIIARGYDEGGENWHVTQEETINSQIRLAKKYALALLEERRRVISNQ